MHEDFGSSIKNTLIKRMLFICYISYKINIEKNINYMLKTYVTNINNKIYGNLIGPISFFKKITIVNFLLLTNDCIYKK